MKRAYYFPSAQTASFFIKKHCFCLRVARRSSTGTLPVTEEAAWCVCISIIHSAPAFSAGTGKMPLRPFHHKRLQPPRSLRERKSPKLGRRQRRLPGRGREEGEQRRADSGRGRSRPASPIAADTLTTSHNCNRKVG